MDLIGYFTKCCLGGRKFLLKEKDENIPKARAHCKRYVYLIFATIYFSGCTVVFKSPIFNIDELNPLYVTQESIVQSPWSANAFSYQDIYWRLGYRSSEIPRTWQQGQFKERAGFSVSRSLTTPSAPPRALIDDLSCVPKNKKDIFTSVRIWFPIGRPDGGGFIN